MEQVQISTCPGGSKPRPARWTVLRRAHRPALSCGGTGGGEFFFKTATRTLELEESYPRGGKHFGIGSRPESLKGEQERHGKAMGEALERDLERNC